jgi:hypothetical protein
MPRTSHYSASATEDQIMLDNIEKKKKQVKQDEKVLERVETLNEIKITFTKREQDELDRLEKAKTHFKDSIRVQEEKRDKEIRRLEDIHTTKVAAVETNYERATQYFFKQLEDLELNQQKIRDRYSDLLQSTEKKQERLKNKIITPQVKKQLEPEVQEETKKPVEALKPVEPTVIKVEEPKQKIKIQPKKVGVKSQTFKKKETIEPDDELVEPISGAELHRQQWIFMNNAREEHRKECEQVLMAKNRLLSRLIQERKDMSLLVVPPTDDELYEKERDILNLQDEISLIQENMPKGELPFD